jgi:hypothetical protein
LVHECAHQTDLLPIAPRHFTESTTQINTEALSGSGNITRTPQSGSHTREIAEDLLRSEPRIESQITGQVPDSHPTSRVTGVRTQDGNSPARRTYIAEHTAQRGRLAGPIRAEECVHLSARNRNGQRSDSSYRTESLREPLEAHGGSLGHTFIVAAMLPPIQGVQCSRSAPDPSTPPTHGYAVLRVHNFLSRRAQATGTVATPSSLTPCFVTATTATR